LLLLLVLLLQEAVTLAREKAVHGAVQDAADEASNSKSARLKAFFGRKGQAGSKEERTLSGRSDSAGSLGGKDTAK
jgi:hypothetical protein